MDPSSLIFVAIIVIWAAYLLGHWVRRRDQLATARSIDRFSATLRVLERRAPAPPARAAAPTYVVAPVRAPAPVAPIAPARTSARAAAVRRRTLLLTVLVAATAVSWPLALLAPLPLWVAAVMSLLLVAMLAQLRSTARRQRQRAVAVRRRALARTSREEVRAVVGQVTASRDHRLAQAAERAVVPSASVVDQPDVDRGWSPVPVPPPTYTLKPKAPPVVRAQPAPVAVPPPVFDLDEILERRIAAGG